MRRTFGWRGAAAAYAKSAGGFLNSAAKSAEKLGLASGKAGKQLGYALHRTLSAEWLLREREVVGLPQGLPELLDGAIGAGGTLRDLPAVPAPLVALARRRPGPYRGKAPTASAATRPWGRRMSSRRTSRPSGRASTCSSPFPGTSRATRPAPRAARSPSR